MQRPLRIGLIVVVAASIHPLARTAEADDPVGRNRPITIVGSPSILPEGIQCQVKLNPETNDRKDVVDTTYEGMVAKTTDEGIMLTVTSEMRRVSKKSPASKIPLVNRLVRNVGIGRPQPGKEKNVWIPAEKIQSVTMTRQSQ